MEAMQREFDAVFYDLGGTLRLVERDAAFEAGARRRIAELEREQDDARARITALESERKRTLAERDALAASLEAQRQAFQKSWSWRITAPLRLAGIADMFRRAVRRINFSDKR